MREEIMVSDKAAKDAHEQLVTSEKVVRIAIQGVRGAFHEIAARYYQQSQALEIIPANTFQDLIELAQNPKETDGAIMAIENTIYGSILTNYELINNSELEIIGEVFLRVQQNLLVLKGQKIEDLTEVYSHPVALAQCGKFFKPYPHIKLISMEDTALSAKMVQENQWKHAGAIASSLAAEMYELETLAAGIETNKLNFTRFLILAPRQETTRVKDFDKVSICFTLGHEVGSLHKLLSILAVYNANLTKIQSVPIEGRPWEYRFFVDYLIDNPENFEKAILVVEQLTSDLKVLGKYKRGIRYEG
jgi:prephenate dehydratase